MSEDNVTLTLPVLPVKNTTLFPRLLMPLTAGRPISLSAIDAALGTEDKTLAVFTQKDPTIETPGQDDLWPVGTLAVIKKMERIEEAVQLIVHGQERVRLEALEQKEPHLVARVTLWPFPEDDSAEFEARHRAVLDQVAKIQAMAQPAAQLRLTQIVAQVQDPVHQMFLFASMLGLEQEKERALLEAPTRAEAMRLLHDDLAHELQVQELRNEITSQAQSEMSREQRHYLLRQQMRAIQEELGEDSPEKAEVAELRQRLDEADLPEGVLNEAERELGRLERMPAAAPDYQITRGYVELLLELPWNKRTEDNLDLDHARRILDEDHFDLDEVKDRIIEHLAVLELNPEAKAPILCFVGPPGVGKTSLGQSIARALGRQFERLSLGGMHDEAELRGHRRTYIGAMPGRIIQAIRRAGVRNPVLMLDEVDKLGRDFRGDPAAALLEILDPAQNHDFRDNYLGLPFDLRQVFFITTANTLDTVPRPLLDRMERLHLAGYSDSEKVEIARRYLIPRQIGEAGLEPTQLQIPAATLDTIIRRYTREAGVRNLERMLGALARKAAVRVAKGQSEPLVVIPDDLPDLLGPARFTTGEARRELPPGVAAGLAWTESGGEVLYVEAVLLPGGRGMTLTGHLGDVMQESVRAARSYVWSRADELGIPAERLREYGVHVHVPAGAIPKDGPSAGVTMASALVSIYTGAPVRSNAAMTGEISLTGLVLPVGGIKEKLLAAHRAGMRRVIVPHENGRNLRELPDHVRAELDIVLAERIDDVWRAAIPDLTERLGRSPVTTGPAPETQGSS